MAEAENAKLRELLGIEQWGPEWKLANIREIAATEVRKTVSAQRDRLALRLAAIEALFAGGPDTACRTRWEDGIECVSVPIEALREVLDPP